MEHNRTVFHSMSICVKVTGDFIQHLYLLKHLASVGEDNKHYLGSLQRLTMT